MGLRPLMGNINIQALSSSPTALGLSAAALLSAVLTGAMPPYAKTIPRLDIRWNAPDASELSFQALDVLHGSTVGTTKAAEPDAWQDLEALREDWDASGAQPVSRDAIDHAKRFLKSFSSVGAPFTPFAHPDGSVGLESRKSAAAAYLIVSPTDRFTYVLRIGQTVHRGDDVDASKMRELLALLY